MVIDNAAKEYMKKIRGLRGRGSGLAGIICDALEVGRKREEREGGRGAGALTVPTRGGAVNGYSF